MKCPNCLIQTKLTTDMRRQRVLNICRECGFMAPANYLNITEMFAFISVDSDGNEGVIAMNTSMGLAPMVGADMNRINQFRPHAIRLAKSTGQAVKLIKFTSRVELEEYPSK